MYKAFLTDYMGTLIVDGFPIAVRFAERGAGISEGRLQRIITEKYWPLWSLGQINEEEFWTKSLEEAEPQLIERIRNRDVPANFPTCFTESIAICSRDLFSGPYPSMIEFFERLRNNQIRTGIITNISPELLGYLKEEKFYSIQSGQYRNLVEIFDTIVASCEVGVRKPDERIYRVALDRLGVSPEETVYVDNESVDLEGAKKLGVTTVKFPSMEKEDLTPLAYVKDVPRANYNLMVSLAELYFTNNAQNAVSMLKELYKEGR